MAVNTGVDQKELQKAFAEEVFIQTKPEVKMTYQEGTLSFEVEEIPGAEKYELYRCLTRQGDYRKIAEYDQPKFEWHEVDTYTKYYKIRAVKGEGEKAICSPFSSSIKCDMVERSKEARKAMQQLIADMDEKTKELSYDELVTLRRMLDIAGHEAKEKERRRREAIESEKRRKREEVKARKRKEAAEREAERLRKEEEERVESITRMDLPADWTNLFEEDERTQEKTETISDALMRSLDLLGEVDIEFISAVAGEDMQTVITELKGAIYQNPLYWDEVFYKGWETADEYLSGNLVSKYQTAKAANEKYNGYFESNLTALKGLMQDDLDISEIYVTLGSPWVPTDVIDDFIYYMALGNDVTSQRAVEYLEANKDGKMNVIHNVSNGTWVVPEKNRFTKSKYAKTYEKKVHEVFGTDRVDMLNILENCLNMKRVSVLDSSIGNSKKVLNQEETIRAIEKQEYMIQRFQDWVKEDQKRADRLKTAYNAKYGNFRKRHYDGSFLELPGLNKDVKLYDYQKNAVARILFSPNTLLAHEVGSGKTYVMIVAGMELRRLEKSRKNLYVIPNNLIGQWEELFHTLYPEAHILTVSHENFGPKQRGNTLGRIRDEDFDAILMTYSCFDSLSLSRDYYIKLNEERLEKLEKAEKALNGMKDRSLTHQRTTIKKTLEELRKSYNKPVKLIPFDDLGINTLFVDEAHNYKNVDIQSKINGVRGNSRNGSDRANAMMDKVHAVQRMNDGGRIVFATGTPVTNSLSDIYVMQKYLQEGEMEFQQIDNFDSWAGMYAEQTTGFEIDVDTNHYRMTTRFSRFRNLPELSGTLSSIMDYHAVDKANGIPEIEGYSDSVSNGSDDFKEFLAGVSGRADDIRNRRVSVQEDNMLKLTTDGRKAALDMRLIDEVFGLEPEAKVLRCADNVYEEYMKSREEKSTQLVFLDVSTPRKGFNLYDDLKGLLVAMGIPKEEIRYIHDASTEAEKNALFEKVRKGEVAVLVGSTAKMGHGMNVQDRLIALHHLDIPWKPSDMVQREGRILRQGNKNEKVRIYRYITKASFDAYSWQLLETKQRFISQIINGQVNFREGNEIDNTVLNYGEVKALAVGNPEIKRRVEVKNQLDRYYLLRKAFVERVQKDKRTLRELPAQIKRAEEEIEKCEKDMAVYQEALQNAPIYANDKEMLDDHRQIRRAIDKAVREGKNQSYETEVLTYMGFKVVVPAYMVPSIKMAKGKETEDRVLSKIQLRCNGSYNVEVGAESGILKRLNNFLEDGLKEKKENLERSLKGLQDSLEVLSEAGECPEFEYDQQIAALENELKQLNRKLGVA